MNDKNAEDIDQIVREAPAATEPKLNDNDPDKKVIIEMVESVKQSFSGVALRETRLTQLKKY